MLLTLAFSFFVFAAEAADTAANTGGVKTACKKVVISGDPDFPPFNWYDGKVLKGAAIDIVVAALKKINLSYEVTYSGPFPRMLAEAGSGHIDIVAELKNTEDRRQFLEFPLTPIFVNPVSVFVPRGSKVVFKQWDDLKKYSGGITIANKFGDRFDKYLQENLKIETAKTIEHNFAKLKAKRIDYFITSYYPGISFLIQSKQDSDFEALKPDITSSMNYAGWSKKSPCIGRMSEFDKALTELSRSGELTRILDANLSSFRAKPAK